jgi:hypothetical protein
MKSIKPTLNEAENRNKSKLLLVAVPLDVIELLKIISSSDDRMYKEEARRLVRKYCH